MVELTKIIIQEYETYWDRAYPMGDMRSQWIREVAEIGQRRYRYEAIARVFGMPWEVVGTIHQLESGCDFTTHLHNGDPLSEGRTTNEPKGRPPYPGPFTWEDSARDALGMKSPFGKGSWGIASTLWWMERYNGWGYRKYHPHIKSPYIVGGSQFYSKGKYTSDGIFSEDAVSEQVGAVLLLKGLGWRPDNRAK